MRFLTLASSSAGNASLLSCGETHLLIDAGISCLRLRRSLAELGLTLEDLSALLITHAHNDHIAGLATLVKRVSLPILCTPETGRQICYRVAGVASMLRPIQPGGTTQVADCRITSIPTSHDIPGSTGFRLDWAGRSVGYLTDTGIIPQQAQALLGADLLVLEANHDVETLLSGPYPYYLKERVLGRWGHLSNEAAAQFAAQAARCGTGDIILAHLSKENNTPQMAWNTVSAALSAAGYTGRLTVAPRDTMGEIHRLEGRTCSASR